MNPVCSEIPIDRQCQVITSHEWECIEKAPGVLSHPNKDKDGKRTRSLLDADYDWEEEAYLKDAQARKEDFSSCIAGLHFRVILGASTKIGQVSRMHSPKKSKQDLPCHRDSVWQKIQR